MYARNTRNMITWNDQTDQYRFVAVVVEMDGMIEATSALIGVTEAGRFSITPPGIPLVASLMVSYLFLSGLRIDGYTSGIPGGVMENLPAPVCFCHRS